MALTRYDKRHRAGIRLGSVAIALLLFGWLMLRDSGAPPTHAPTLPPWFGDANRPAARIAGNVIGAPHAMTVHLLLDVPDPALWKWREVHTSASGEFDLGPTRPGRYRMFAHGNGWLSRVVTIDTMRSPGDRVELFAHEWLSTAAKLDALGRQIIHDSEWGDAYRLWAMPITTWIASGPPVVGAVLRADGTPAAFVGVQPVACSMDDHSSPLGMDLVATTTAGGGFAFVSDLDLCGLRIFMGATTHEIKLERQPRQPLVIQLPAAGREQRGIFDPYRREYGDPQGAWLRGRVVHDGVPAADVDVTATVLAWNYMVEADETRTRSDGTFELFVSSKELDKTRPVLLYARQTLTGLAGRQLVRVGPGANRGELLLEIGSGVRVSGTVTDEEGQPIAGIRVGVDSADPRSWSEPSGADGSFRLTVGPQGRHRLLAIVAENIVRDPPSGEFPPRIDVTTPSGEQTGVKLVVSNNQHRCCEYRVLGGYADVGVEIANGVVTAVGDELEAAGLRIGDEIVSVQQKGVELEQWKLWKADVLHWGAEEVLTVKRGEDTIRVRAKAPLFGSPAT